MIAALAAPNVIFLAESQFFINNIKDNEFHCSLSYRMNTKVMIICTVLAVAVVLQSTPTEAAWGSCLSQWKTINGIGIVSTVVY